MEVSSWWWARVVSRRWPVERGRMSRKARTRGVERTRWAFGERRSEGKGEGVCVAAAEVGERGG